MRNTSLIALTGLLAASSAFAPLMPYSLELPPCWPTVAREALPQTFAAWVFQPANPVNLLPPNVDKPVLVIGGGPAGLAAMAGMKQRNVLFEGVERHTGPGGLWDDRNPSSPAYQSLTTNSSRTTTHLGPPVPGDWPAYLTRERALEYLQTFATSQGLMDKVHWGVGVTKAEPQKDGTWIATLKHGASGREITREFRAIVVATGRHSRENAFIPDGLLAQAEAAGIKATHASQYREPSGFKDKLVLVVGVGNSGAEIATEIAGVSSPVLLSVRTPPWIVPLWVLGTPADEFAATGPKLPHWLEMFFFHALQRWYVGHPTRLGFPSPEHGLLDRLPVSDRGIAAALRAGKILVRPTVTGFQNHQVVFEGGVTQRIDEVVFATGYRSRYPFLPESLMNWDTAENPPSLLLFHPTHPNLIIMTEAVVPQGGWPLFADQGQFVGAYFSAWNRRSTRLNRLRALLQALPPDLKGPIFSAASASHTDAHRYSDFLRQGAMWLDGDPQ